MIGSSFRLAAAFLAAVACGPASALSDAETPRERSTRMASEAERRRQAEIGYEARYRSHSLRSGCDAPVEPERPRVCVTVSGTTAVPKGDRLRYRVEWRDVPAGAGLIVTLERAAPVGERWRYAGITGPVQLFTIPVSGSGARDLEWSGREIGCAPADAPTWCDGVEIGAYTLTATILDLPDYNFLGWPDRRPYRPLTWAKSAPFSIDGALDLGSLLNKRQAVTDYLRRRLGFFVPHYDRTILDRPLPAAHSGASGYCAGIELRLPLQGVLTACLPQRSIDRHGVRATGDDLVFSGAIGYRKGLIAQDRAEAVARRIAVQGHENVAHYFGRPDMRQVRAQYGEEAAKERTWLETTLIEPNYRHEVGGYWLFLMHNRLHTIGGSLAGIDAKLLVKVEPDGTGCLIDHRSTATPGPDIGARSAGNGLSETEARSRYDPETWQQPCARQGGAPSPGGG